MNSLRVLQNMYINVNWNKADPNFNKEPHIVNLFKTIHTVMKMSLKGMNTIIKQPKKDQKHKH